MNTRRQQFGGPWTEDKLEYVQKYLCAYTTIMVKQNFRFAYIDAFAGTGYRESKQDGDTESAMFPEFDFPEVIGFQQGSVRNALEVKPPFQKYVFIEKSAKKHARLLELKKEFLLKAEFSENSIECVREDANPYLRNLCGKTDWHSHRSLVFLDPFGMQVEWETIQAIAHTKAIDLWILFPIGAVNRLLRRDGEIHVPNRKKLDLCFGDSDWFEVFYQLAEQISLFNPEEQIAFYSQEEHWQKTSDIFKNIERYFIKRLQSVFARVVPNPLWLCQSKNVPLYLLCFASENKTACKIAQDILLKPLRQGISPLEPQEQLELF